MTTVDPATLEAHRDSGCDLRHSLEAVDGTVIPAWSTVAPTAWPCVDATATLVVIRDRTQWTPGYIVPGTILVVRTEALCLAAGERQLGLPEDGSRHRDDGRCCRGSGAQIQPKPFK